MTEKEFEAAVRAGVMNGTAGLVASKIAREHGARFDPEPVRLPPVRVGQDAKCQIFRDTGDLLTEADAAEVARRCNAWEKVRALTEPGPGGQVINKQFLRQTMDEA